MDPIDISDLVKITVLILGVAIAPGHIPTKGVVSCRCRGCILEAQCPSTLYPTFYSALERRILCPNTFVNFC
jgi:hypothetical protein